MSNAERLAPGGERREVAVLFSDLRGFTSYAERLPPERLVQELNDYLAAMVEAVHGQGGTVDKYIGDSIMAVLGLMGSDPEDAARAIRTADSMQRALARHNADRASRRLPPLKQGIGVHFGQAIVGNIGTENRLQFTVVGDVVNTASRLKSATKSEGAPVLVSAAAVEAARRASADLPPLRPHGELRLRGRDSAIATFTLVTGDATGTERP
ncbi:MAG: adenylate/guanylate cyclase domain-containing protein [Deltaproteobacteria bacterium]|nr:adenylate/guanylate cyclase domain-containing protein [Deltaproteobacteria bacterium]